MDNPETNWSEYKPTLRSLILGPDDPIPADYWNDLLHIVVGLTTDVATLHELICDDLCEDCQELEDDLQADEDMTLNIGTYPEDGRSNSTYANTTVSADEAATILHVLDKMREDGSSKDPALIDYIEPPKLQLAPGQSMTLTKQEAEHVFDMLKLMRKNPCYTKPNNITPEQEAEEAK